MSAKPSQRPAESLFALVLVVFSVTAFWQAYRISGFSGPSTPGVFPMLAAATMALSALFILRRSAAQRLPAEGSASGPRRFFREVTPARHRVMLGFIFLYVVAMPLLGFIISSGLFLFAAFAYLWRKHALVSLVLTAGSLAAIYAIFRVVFQVVLPNGTLVQGLF